MDILWREGVYNDIILIWQDKGGGRKFLAATHHLIGSLSTTSAYRGTQDVYISFRANVPPQILAPYPPIALYANAVPTALHQLSMTWQAFSVGFSRSGLSPPKVRSPKVLEGCREDHYLLRSQLLLQTMLSLTTSLWLLFNRRLSKACMGRRQKISRQILRCLPYFRILKNFGRLAPMESKTCQFFMTRANISFLGSLEPLRHPPCYHKRLVPLTVFEDG